MNSATIPKHVATLFDLKVGQDTVYRFSIDKWFIARYGVDSDYSGTTDSALTYCTIPWWGNKYRVPSLLNDYINASITISAGDTGGNYTRTIGGGLFAEWGFTARDFWYPNGDFELDNYWASEFYDSNHQYSVLSLNGNVDYSDPEDNLRTACVSP